MVGTDRQAHQYDGWVEALIWRWKLHIAAFVAWLSLLKLVREYDAQLSELYILLSFFVLAFGVIGFTPRREGELSAYSHFNANNERLLGDLDPNRAGRELTGQSMFDHQTVREEEEEETTGFGGGGRGNVLGSGGSQFQDEDHDLQRALLLSLREEREARRRKG